MLHYSNRQQATDGQTVVVVHAPVLPSPVLTHLEHIVVNDKELPGCHERVHLQLQGLRFQAPCQNAK